MVVWQLPERTFSWIIEETLKTEGNGNYGNPTIFIPILANGMKFILWIRKKVSWMNGWYFPLAEEPLRKEKDLRKNFGKKKQGSVFSK